MKPTVSVIIPTHNRSHLVSHALDSVFAQEGAGMRFDLEVIVVDDASTDGTAEVIARYPRVRYIRLATCHGVSGARNAGIAASRGPYVAFLDDDDVWGPTKLSLQVAALEAHPDAGVAYGQVLIAGAGRQSVFPDSDAPSGSLFPHLLFVNLCVLPAVLVRRTALDLAGRFTPPPLEDYDMWVRLARRVPFVFVPAVLGIYRTSEGGILGTAVREGGYAAALRRITEDALAGQPDTAMAERLRRGVRASVEIRIADALAARGETAPAWRHLQAGAEQDPGMALIPRNRTTIAHIVGREASQADRPTAAARNLWRTLTCRVPRGGVGTRVALARLLADVYWEVAAARRAGRGCPPSSVLAAQAAAQALLVYPVDAIRWRALLRFLVRSRGGSSATPRGTC
jgi:hypothetical protein